MTLRKCCSAFAALLVLAAGTAFGQNAASGSIAGVVKDTTGAVLPGVTVEAASPALIEKVRTAVTDDKGNYKLLDLRPGSYTVTFTLPGFSTFKRDGIELTTGFTATVNGDLKVGSLEETVTVSGAAPTVDVQRVSASQVLSRETLDSIPTGRTIQGYAALTVGAAVSAGLVDVGGNQGERYGHIAIHGGREGDGMLNIDGMRFNNMVNSGSGANRHYFINQGAVQEVNLETGGMNAESDTAGVAVNAVPKDGGNTFAFYGNVNGTNGSLQSSNITDALRARGANAATSLRKMWDYNAGVGGPLQKDKLWFYTAHRWWGTQSYPPNTYYDKNPDPFQYTPDLDRPGYSDLYQRDNSVRFTYQASARHKFTVSNSFQNSCFCFQAVETRAPEASIDFRYSPINLFQTTWSYPRTNKLLVEAGMSYMHNMTNPSLIEGVKDTDISITEATTGIVYNSPPGSVQVAMLGTDVYYGQHNERFSVSYITGSHALKIGTQTRQGVADFGSIDVNQSISYTFRNGAPLSLTQWATPAPSVQKEKLSLGIFLQDQWTLNRLTLNLGVRYNYQNSYVPAQERPATRFVPAARFDKIENVPNWHDVTPRLGAAYDLFGNGKTAIKGYLGRFVNAHGVSFAQISNPANAIVLRADRTWTDANGNFTPDCDLVSSVANGECGALSDRAFGTVRITTRLDDSVLSGFGVRDYTWQANAAFQHEIRPGLGLNIGYFRTWFGNFTATDNTLVAPSDFDPFCVTAPTDSRLGDYSGRQMCGLYDVNPSRFGQNNNLIVQAKDFGKRTEVFNGVDITFNYKFGKGGMLQGGTGIGRTVTDNCIVIDSPQAGRDGYCKITPPWSANTQLKLAAVYPLPGQFQIAANFQNMPGFAQAAQMLVTNAAIAPSLGRNLAAGAAGTALVDILPANTLFEDRFNQVDLRLTKILRVGKTGRIQARFDAYNITNSSSVLSSVSRIGAQWLRPTNILGARTFKLGAQVDW
jgi:hypothetical protein